MTRKIQIILSLGLSISLYGCRSGASGARVQVMHPVGESRAAELGRIGDEVVSLADLSPEVRESLNDVDNEFAQRRLHLLWMGFEEAVEARLLRQEAAKRGITVEALQEEIAKESVPPTEQELRAVYDENKDVIGVDFEVAQDQLRQQLTRRRREQAQQAWIDKLRGQVEVKYSLPVPQLPRFAVKPGKAPVRGKRGAKVTLVEFSDFQCPYCAQAHRLINQLEALYPDSLQIVFKDFPLAQHAQARPAAEAAQCANEQGKFWPYHDALFENQKALDDSDLKRYADDVELDVSMFEKCLDSERPKLRVASHEEEARRFGVQGTPAIFINGIKLIGLLPLPLMRVIIDHELGR